jgi:RNA polymerase sigma-70 factor, ECF subfamily
VRRDRASVTAALAGLFPDGWDFITATLTRLTSDRGLAEECAQDAFARALARWPVDGIPDKPLAWLVTTARNRALDRARRAMVEAEKLRLLAREAARQQLETVRHAAIPDERLEMMFTCAHPALTTDAQVALILSALTGLSTADIADAFLVTERAMRQRLFRAKQRLRQAGTPLTPPRLADLPRRLPAILHVLHLMFSAGYAGTGGAGPLPQRMDDALALSRMLVSLLPGEPEALGLLALMLLHHARRDACSVSVEGGDGRRVTRHVAVAEQDRLRWDRAEIAEGLNLAVLAISAGRPGPFQVQAAIASFHDVAPAAAATNWRAIARCYAKLAEVTPRPAVIPSQSLATAIADSPEAGLLFVCEPKGGRAGRQYELPPAARAGLLRRTRRLADAASAYQEALDEAASIAAARAGIPRTAGLSRREPPG